MSWVDWFWFYDKHRKWKKPVRIRNRWGWGSMCIILIVVWPLVAYLLDYLLRSQEIPHHVDKEQWLIDDVNNNPYHMTDMLTQRGRPALLTNTPYDNWSIWDWSFDSLASRVKLVLVKKSSDQMIKYYGTSQLVESEPLERPYQEILFPVKKFFEKLTDQSDGYYYYASGGIELLGINSSSEVYSDELLRQVTFRSHNSLGQVNFWIGSGNVTAHTHYDTSHNLHVVIRGRKKFLLWPPSDYHHLKLYPCLHHYYRQTFYTYTTSPSIVPTPIEIVLQPSDVIYIPPYWFHEVVTMEPGISINVWSNSDTFLIMEEVYRAAIPFEEHWGHTTLVKSLWYFLHQLVTMVITPDAKFEDVIRKLVSDRYNFMSGDIIQGSHDLTDYCLTEHISDILDTSSIIHIEKGSSRVAELFLKMPCLASREINLGNYIEYLCHRILGGDQLHTLPVILYTCFGSHDPP
ncbi:hypoxia-inducible factor 1-alpha inhibitor-like isoform X2 [Dysidea avara]|uniref:hypoxia-inducible factor 1-alpha inhibitor-like isoform X2 n=1 Tax=Dysidea avara TaxID=196820 RepID=UPI003323BE96